MPKLDDRILDAHFLGCHVVLKHGLAVQADPCVRGAGDRDLDIGVCLHVLIDILGIVGAEPQLAVQLAGKHERTALGLAVAADGRKVLYGVLLQKLDNFIHDRLPPIEIMEN